MRQLLFFCFLFIITNLSAQIKIKFQPEYKVNYKYIFCYDTTDLTKQKITTMTLYAGNAFSVYRNSRYEDYEEALALLTAEATEMVTSGNKTNPPKGSPALTLPPGELFTTFGKNFIHLKEVLRLTNYIINDTILPIKWYITKESKKLSSIICQKAVGQFRGRNYTAWFAPSIPLPAGPSKLGGLPGIILEAYDDTNEVKYLFVSLDKITTTKAIETPKKYIQLTKKEWRKILKAYQDDPVAFAKNESAASGVTVAIGFPDSKQPPANKQPQKTIINNLVEKNKD